MSYHYINGTFTQEAFLSINDVGLTRGFGVFDVLRTYKKKPFHLCDHFERLVSSGKGIGLNVPVAFNAYKEIVEELLDRTPLPDVVLKTIVTGGTTTHRLLPKEKPTLIISALPLISFPEEAYSSGISACTTSLKRPFPKCKTLFYVPAILALMEGEKQGADEAIYLNDKHELLEGATSNFFAIKRGTLITSPDEDVLSGITYGVVLRLAKGELPILRRALPYTELTEIDEAFVTSCNKEILPVTRIDGIPIGSGAVGTHTQRLMHLFQNYVEKEVWKPFTEDALSLHTKSGSPAGSCA